ncbi:hypothetical protein D6853_14480 [Butyrivibrio sp. X503]|uniref:hypothetical protein n=1 Tax=Butyrivibrio sp. X503 TaxID=2364878 RepID=UPI000EA95A15|nr:hypothetical protein [Butyrivibrio sp. X503]RKM54141.1 hypothetical protein D6853_14480 [Butyrivibrio sp. X503]
MSFSDIRNGRWYYSLPKTSPDSNGNIVLIMQSSVGPVEVFECGLDSDMKPYESYEWLENDFFADDNYCKEISEEELFHHIKKLMELFESNNIHEGVKAYEEILIWLKERGICEN